jgi:CheY-like chemotaxis protein/HPt (histidine-containing phosphotransfer) domain-containing protein
MAEDFSEDGLDAKLIVEFRDQAQDRLANLNALINAAQDGATLEATLPALNRDIQNLKGLAAGYGYPLINMVAQRLETYVAGLASLQGRTLPDLQQHIDRMLELVDRRVQPTPEDAARLIHELPTRYDFNVSDIVVKNIEIMLVTPSRVAAKLVGGELAACGFRPITMHDPIEALAQAVRVVPGMILASVVMEPINGVELVRALKLMRPTRNCPMAVLTSMDGDKKPLHELPPDVAVIHTGDKFGEDFAAVTGKFGLG